MRLRRLRRRHHRHRDHRRMENRGRRSLLRHRGVLLLGRRGHPWSYPEDWFVWGRPAKDQQMQIRRAHEDLP